MKESGDLRKAGLVRARSPYNIIHQCFTFKNVSKLSKLHMIKYGGNIYKRESLKFEKERMKIYTKGSRGKKQKATHTARFSDLLFIDKICLVFNNVHVNLLSNMAIIYWLYSDLLRCR